MKLACIGQENHKIWVHPGLFRNIARPCLKKKKGAWDAFHWEDSCSIPSNTEMKKQPENNLHIPDLTLFHTEKYI